ncbi:MAG: 1-phosphofructokinase family hexose kinase [Sebaldella sp.]|nr:1-phosphofructokinase family hexose kinase [Sebaldella sp.]
MIYTITLNPAIDKIIEIENKLEREKNNKIKRTLYDIGGKGCHVSTVIAAHKIPNIATGFTGGENGRKLINLLENREVKCKFIDVEDSNTRECTILVDETNLGSFMITESGEIPNDKAYQNLLLKIRNDVKKDDIVALSGSPATGFSTEKYCEIVREIKKTEAKLFIDARDEYLQEAVTLAPYFIKPNKHEFQTLIGKKLNTIEEYIKEITKLMETINIVVVSLGEEGSIVGIKNNGIYNFRPPKVNVVSETGCGDIFVGGVISQIYLNKDIIEVFKFATAISASKATHFLSSDFSLEQTEKLLDKVYVKKYI